MNDDQVALLRFGIPTLDLLFGSPSWPQTPVGHGDKSPSCGIGLRSKSTGPGGESNEQMDALSLCLIGSDGVGKSILAMHLVSKYRSDFGSEPFIFYASTDLTHGRAAVSWENFALDYPQDRIEDPFDYLQVEERVEQIPDPTKAIQLKSCEPLNDPLPGKSGGEVLFLDLATHTTGDDWGYLNRLLASLPCPADNEPRHLLVVDAVEGLEVLVGETDAFGQLRDRRSRVAQLIRTAAGKCHVVLLVESQREGIKTPEEFIADAVIRLGSSENRGYQSRFVRVEKVRGQTHVRGEHDIAIRSGTGSTTGRRFNADDPRVYHPRARAGFSEREKRKLRVFEDYESASEHVSGADSTEQNAVRADRCQAYTFVFHSLHLLSRRVMAIKGDRFLPLEEKKDEFGKDREKRLVAGFGIEHLDEILISSSAPKKEVDGQETVALEGDLFGLPVTDPVALIGEPGTHCSKLSKAFLARGQHPDYDYPGTSVLLTTKTLEEAGLKERLDDHLVTKIKKKRKEGKHVFCRRLEIHYISSSVLLHIIKQLVRRAQASIFKRVLKKTWVEPAQERRRNGWRVRLVIDNWTSICDTYPQVRDDPLFLPCLLFYLRREGIATLIVANEEQGFMKGFKLNHTRRLRDLTPIQIYTWRVPFFGESRVAITVMPPQQGTGRGSVIRELRLLKEKQWVEEDTTWRHIKLHGSRKIGLNPSLELYDGLEDGDPHYVPLQVWLYAGGPGLADRPGASQKDYPADVSTMFNWLMCELSGIPRQDASNRKSAGKEISASVGNEGLPYGSVVQVKRPEEYQQLREFSELQGVARFPYTLVLQVDEYWAKSNSLQLHSQHDYLCSRTAAHGWRSENGGKWKRAFYSYIVQDPFRLFQPSRVDLDRAAGENPVPQNPPTRETGIEESARTPWRRYHFFTTTGYDLCKLLDTQRNRVVKVPYAWDFGFLMVNCTSIETYIRKKRKSSHAEAAARAWRDLKLLGRDPGASAKTVLWHDFARLCVECAEFLNRTGREKPYIPFFVAPEIQETLACLFLEIWVSEIERLPDYARERMKNAKESSSGLKIGDVFPTERHAPESFWSLRNSIDAFPETVVRALLILSALMPGDQITEDNELRDGDANVTPSKKRIPIAMRSWYSAAPQIQENAKILEHAYTPAQLPGTRIVRGDWFLAIARGSRSYQMGERAIDLLSSRRANITRLQTGIGLPVRDTQDADARELWTPLWHVDKDKAASDRAASDKRRITYRELTSLGIPDSGDTAGDMKWLWRSRIQSYDRHARLFRRWICAMLRQCKQLTGQQEPLKVYADIQADTMDSIRAKFPELSRQVSGFVDSLRRATIISGEDPDEAT